MNGQILTFIEERFIRGLAPIIDTSRGIKDDIYLIVSSYALLPILARWSEIGTIMARHNRKELRGAKA